VAVAEAFRSESFAVAGLAVNVLVGTVAGQDRVQRPVAIAAAEALFMPLLKIQITFYLLGCIISLDVAINCV
jgi:hypothetical protein